MSDTEPPAAPATLAELVHRYGGSDWSTAGLPGPYYNGSLRKVSVVGSFDIETGAYDFVEMSEPTFAGGLTALR